MTLEESVDFFVRQAHSLACLSLTCGDGHSLYTARGGVRNEAGEALEEDSIFDLASLTKLFTGLLTMRLHEEGLLDLKKPVTAYAPMFRNLSGIRVEQVLGFEVQLRTGERVDACPDRERALQELFAITPHPPEGRAYSDMHAMVLKYVLEGAGGDGYMHLLSSRILTPLGMTSTFGYVPEDRRPSCVSCNREHRIEGKKWILRDRVAPGTVHDPKARILNTQEDVTGHAGLFSTEKDMVRLCRGVLDGKVVSDSSLKYMAVNRTGRPLPGGGYIQYLGVQCYVRHPEQRHSEVPLYMSDRAMALSGFTGHHLSLDPVTRVFVVSLGSRVMNRLSVLVPEEGKKMEDYGLLPDGRGQITWVDGEKIWSSAGYVYLKDMHMHRAVQDTLGLPDWK